MNELKACPFCENSAQLIKPHNGNPPYVACTVCYIATLDRPDCVELWNSRPAPESHNELREALAALEHEQWMAWSQNIALTLEQYAHAPDVKSRLERWQKLWAPYTDLSEADKDLDRHLADKVLAALAEQAATVKEGVK